MFRIGDFVTVHDVNDNILQGIITRVEIYCYLVYFFDNKPELPYSEDELELDESDLMLNQQTE
jgi:hypothetical protein